MMFIKIFLLFVSLFGLVGCVGGTNNYYILSVPSQPNMTYHINNKVIGIENVTVPAYLYKREIAIANSSNSITLLSSAKWGEDLDVGLTNRVINYLRKKFNNPDIYMYPWDIDNQPNIKISIHISRFIAQGDYVYLDVSYSIENLKSKKRISHLFSIKVATKKDITDIVDAMNRAFSKFEDNLAVDLRKF